MGLLERYSKESLTADIKKFVNILSDEDFTSLRKSATKAWNTLPQNNGIPTKESLEDFISISNILQSGKKEHYKNILPDLLTSKERYELCVYLFFAVNDRFMGK
jgi:hypothetical protein